MAKGWESKSVEAQMETANDAQPSAPKQPLTDGEKKTQRERDSLKLSRAYVQQQIESSTNERYTESLRKALDEIEQKLAKLGSPR
jgi:hypothetical protein